MALLDSAEGSDLADLLEVLADVYWHPGMPFLARVQDRLTHCVADMPVVAICTSFWAFAVFAYTPSIPMQKAYALQRLGHRRSGAQVPVPGVRAPLPLVSWLRKSACMSSRLAAYGENNAARIVFWLCGLMARSKRKVACCA